MDFVGPFPKSEHGHDYLWVIVDRFTSLVHLVPVNTTITARDLAWTYVKEIVRLHGLPDSIVSDRDSKFISAFWRETQRLLGTKLKMSTAYHPQTDGLTERTNRRVVFTMLLHDSNHLVSAWAQELPVVMEWLGVQNIFVSVYESGSGDRTAEYLRDCE